MKEYNLQDDIELFIEESKIPPKDDTMTIEYNGDKPLFDTWGMAHKIQRTEVSGYMEAMNFEVTCAKLDEIDPKKEHWDTILLNHPVLKRICWIVFNTKCHQITAVLRYADERITKNKCAYPAEWKEFCDYDSKKMWEGFTGIQKGALLSELGLSLEFAKSDELPKEIQDEIIKVKYV